MKDYQTNKMASTYWFVCLNVFLHTTELFSKPGFSSLAAGGICTSSPLKSACFDSGNIFNSNDNISKKRDDV